LSDWTLERRVIGPWSERADHLTATLHLAKQLEWVSDVDTAAAERLRGLVKVYAATVPGAQRDPAVVDTEQIQNAANAELAVIGERDAQWRAEAEQRASFLTDEQRLWGASPPRIVHRRA
jgi:hypothetical protein